MPIHSFINISVAGIAFFSGLYSFRNVSRNFKLVVVFTGIAFITEMSLTILIARGIKTTMPGLHFYIMVEFLLWALFYRSMLHPYIRKSLLTAFILVFELYVLIIVLFIQDLFTMPNLVGSIEGLILVLFSILLFARIMVEAKYQKLWSEPLVWINIAVLFYFSGNFFFNILFNLIMEYSNEFSKVTLKYFMGLNAFFYLMIATGFLKARKNIKIHE